jgi:GH24 family phage-related lysozyme (muramidase)
MASIHPMMVPMLRRWETYVQEAHVDKGKDKPLVIGYGHTNANDYPPFVHEGLVLRDEPHAMEILIGELNNVYVPQLDGLFAKIGFTPPNDLYYSGWLDALYNRGAGRVAGADAGSKLKGSYAWHILKTMRGEKHWMVLAANALSHSHVEDFTPLDEAWDETLNDGAGGNRIYAGLVGRRACDTALCLWERF